MESVVNRDKSYILKLKRANVVIDNSSEEPSSGRAE